MTLQYNDGFDWVDTTSDTTIRTQLAYDAWTISSPFNPHEALMVGGAGVYGGKYVGYKNNGGNGALRIQRTLTTARQTVGIGFRFYATAIPSPAGRNEIFSWTDSGTVQLTLCLLGTGALSLYRGNGSTGTLLGTSGTTPIVAASWYFIEVFNKIDPSTGTYDVRVNGVSVLSGTGADTRSTANSSANGFNFGRNMHADLGNLANLVEFRFDDFYAIDDQGSVNNAVLGDCRTEMLVPTANVSAGFTPSAGSNFQCVDEIPLSATADYNAASAAAEDRFSTGGMASTPSSVKAISLVQFSLKTDAGTNTTRNRLTSSGTTGNGTTTAVPTSIGAIRDVFELNPNGNVAWDATTANAAQPGYERVT